MKLFVAPYYEHRTGHVRNFQPSHVKNPIRIKTHERHPWGEGAVYQRIMDMPLSNIIKVDNYGYYGESVFTKEDILNDIRSKYPTARVATYVCPMNLKHARSYWYDPAKIKPDNPRQFDNHVYWARWVFKKLQGLGFEVKFKLLTKTYGWL